jgi:hypothetical protein
VGEFVDFRWETSNLASAFGSFPDIVNIDFQIILSSNASAWIVVAAYFLSSFVRFCWIRMIAETVAFLIANEEPDLDAIETFTGSNIPAFHITVSPVGKVHREK